MNEFDKSEHAVCPLFDNYKSKCGGDVHPPPPTLFYLYALLATSKQGTKCWRTCRTNRKRKTFVFHFQPGAPDAIAFSNLKLKCTCMQFHIVRFSFPKPPTDNEIKRSINIWGDRRSSFENGKRCSTERNRKANNGERNAITLCFVVLWAGVNLNFIYKVVFGITITQSN